MPRGHRHPIPIHLDGVAYPSAAAAAATLGVSTQAIYQRLSYVSRAWMRLDMTRPMRSLRRIAGLTEGLAQEAVGALEGYAPSTSTITSPELRGTAVQLGKLLRRSEAYGLEVEIRVRAKR